MGVLPQIILILEILISNLPFSCDLLSKNKLAHMSLMFNWQTWILSNLFLFSDTMADLEIDADQSNAGDGSHLQVSSEIPFYCHNILLTLVRTLLKSSTSLT